MPIIRLYLGGAPVPRRKPVAPIFKSSSLSRAYFPGRGVPFSLLAHGIVFTVVLLYPLYHNPLLEAAPPPKVQFIDLTDTRLVMFLPILGSGNQGGGPADEKPQGRLDEPSVSSAPGRKGLSYPGPQTILSDPPQPTNTIQTLLQPKLDNPPILPPPLPLPNLVQIAGPDPIPPMGPPEPVSKPPDAVKPAEQRPPDPPPVPAEAKATNSSLPVVELQPPVPIDPSKLTFPASSAPQPPPVPKPPEPVLAKPASQIAPPVKDLPPPEPARADAEPPKSETPPANPEKPKEPPAAEPPSPAKSGTDLLTVVSLTPLPAPPTQRIEVPVGEARGRFAISPDPNLSAPEKEPGSKTGSPASQTVLGNPAATPGSKTPPVATAPVGTGAGGAKDKGGAGSGASADVTPGSRAGSTAGSGGGSGSGTGAGSGTGTGTGKEAFAGITIVGGVRETGAAGNPAAGNPVPPTAPPRPLQTSYGLYVVSTESGGGGLPFYGVFSNDQVYTVYLDMRRTETDTAPSWTLEFAVPQETLVQVNAAANAIQTQQGLVLPFPAEKELPAMPADLVRRYPQKMVIVYAIVNPEGRMEQVSVKDSPDPQLHESVLAALSRWVFRPAQYNGVPVAVKLLMGIPLWSPR
ncbi:MAG: hypothetical protein H6Q05_3389 [Acidobacteria bacterium]|nr:hypothetical protein [Acidobacteriota bacterium]